MNNDVDADVLVIGGGPAGTSAAIGLAGGGAQVLLVERERLPSHKVCGEFLSGETLFYLKRNGLDLSALGAVPIDTVRLAGKTRVTESALPFPAMSLTRRCLDAALLQHAEAAGAKVRRACQVERLVRNGRDWKAQLNNGTTVTASAVFLATGKHDLRGDPRGAGKQQGMVAFKMYWRLGAGERRSLGQAVELFTYPGGYAGLQPVEAGLANLCCLVHADELRRLGGKWNALLAHMCEQAPHLRRRLYGAEPQLSRPLTIASLPYGFVRQRTEGIWYLGDQAVVIPSFTGDGMALAMHTGSLAAERYLRGESAQDFQQAVARQVTKQITVATAVSRALVSVPRFAMSLPALWPGVIGTLARQTRIDSAFWDDRK